ncbi:MAG: hypothetical protein K2K69_01485 [Muribaculaceae bacterium]|nr:hypothetical protein [Bacteroidales bacterium]MDE6436167.1 hypothetical protein [Muribaculaceae bacterium]
MRSLRDFLIKWNATMRSPRGKDIAMFLLFVAISAVLWMVLSLNEEEQRDLRLPVKITQVPDSVTLISPGPEALNVSLRARGTQLFKMSWGKPPTVNIDFRAYRSDGILHLSSADLKALARNATGGAQVSFVYPDSLHIPYTNHAGYPAPIHVDYKATAGPQSALIGRPHLSVDTALVFVAAGRRLPDSFNSVSTEPIRLTDLDRTTTRRVKLLGPKGSRVIPDSVDVTFDVEPLIIKSRKVVIEPVNVPDNVKLITFPAQIDVNFMVPMSIYAGSDAHFRVLADYRTIRHGSKMIKLQLRDVPSNLKNVHLSADSAEYIIEHRK